MELKKNSIYTIEITDMGNEGEGIGHLSLSDVANNKTGTDISTKASSEDGNNVQNITVFVKDTVIGDVAEISIMKAKKSIAYGRLVRLITPSPYRVTPVCPVAKSCGGCSLQHISYEKQLEYKWNKVRECLRRIGKIENPDTLMEPIYGMKEPYHYRNKAQFPVGRDKNGNIVIGFYAGRTHSIIDSDTCAIGAEVNDQILPIIRAFLTEYNISTYNETTGQGLVRHILTRVGFTTGEVMVCLIVNGKKLPHADELISRLTKISGMTSICLNINTEKTNKILGPTCKTLWGSPYITDYIGNVKYQISPLSFYQVNPVQTEKLYGLALEYADLKGDETVWDLYCGIGTISLFLAQKAKFVRGVEIVPQAIDNARENAKFNGIENVEFFVGKAEEVLPEFYAEHKNEKTDMLHPDVIVVDPPRKGCDEKCLETILLMKPERIVYVSCDSATLARDLKVLAEGGYEVKRVRAVDQFAHTTHVETVVLLSKGMVGSRKVKVDFSLEDMDLSEFKGKATYEQIKAYVLEQTGLKVSSLYIAQIKKKCGLDVGENFNLAKSENAR